MPWTASIPGVLPLLECLNCHFSAFSTMLVHVVARAETPWTWFTERIIYYDVLQWILRWIAWISVVLRSLERYVFHFWTYPRLWTRRCTSREAWGSIYGSNCSLTYYSTNSTVNCMKISGVLLSSERSFFNLWIYRDARRCTTKSA
jgi:hypothetical protein